jgi:hypothetical protein
MVHMRRRLTTVLFFALSGALAGCSGDASQPAGPSTTTTSFTRLQRDIFNGGATGTSCVACHTAGSTFAAQSGLVLDDAVAYNNLVGVLPKNANALTDGLMRVMRYQSSGSLLYHKLMAWQSGHHTRDYGSPMPLGGQSLSVGQLEFVRRWIDAGAPTSGDAIDTMLLADRTRPELQPFTPLVPPSEGLQLKIEPFQVNPNFERELFVYRPLKNAGPLYVNRIETKMRTNSHHFIIYTFTPNTPDFVIPAADAIRDIREPDGSMNFGNMLAMGYHVFFGGSMTESGGYNFPPGVALRVPANASLDLNSHYVNKTTQPLTGEVYANLYTVDSTQVQKVAKTLNLDNININLPAGQRVVVTKTFTMSTTTTIFMLTSHMHARGEKFVVKLKGGARDGEVVYTNTDWAAPTITTYATPMVLTAGQGLTSEVTYNNTTTHTISFGLSSEDEMDIIFGYYY